MADALTTAAADLAFMDSVAHYGRNESTITAAPRTTTDIEEEGSDASDLDLEMGSGLLEANDEALQHAKFNVPRVNEDRLRPEFRSTDSSQEQVAQSHATDSKRSKAAKD